MKLSEVSKGISHIEDLPITEFIEILQNFKEYNITEKVDGAQLLFGIDSCGFYTSRETKGGTRIYNEADYGITFASTYMRSAHKLLEQMLPYLKGAGMKPGDQVEAEVLYGELPNVVPYSADTNYLIFLRTTEGTVNIDRLQQKLDGQSVSVSLVSPFTDNGRTIELREETNQWKFARVPKITRTLHENSLKKRARAIIQILETIDSITLQPVSVILETPLNKIPDWVQPGTWQYIKEHIKDRREEILQTIREEHIIPIKEMFLNNLVRPIGSSFGPPRLDGGWIEGIVLRHPDTGRMVKVVDKVVFGAIRERAWQKRNMITETAKGVENHGGFIGRLHLDLATSLGHPELGTNQAKNYLRKSGTITEERLSNLSEGINFDTVKSYWLSLLDIKHDELNEDLDKYEKEEGNTNHPVQERTRQAFAEAFQKIYVIKSSTLQAENTQDLVFTLVGKHLGNI